MASCHVVLAEEKTVTKLGKCLDSPFPYADTLKKEIIFKKDFGYISSCFRIQWRVSKKD